MDKAAQMAGFFVSYAISIISKEAGVLMPFAGFDPPEGRRALVDFDDPQHELRIGFAQKWLEENPDDAIHAVLILDGLVVLPSGRTDALIVEVRKYSPRRESLSMVVPYRPVSSPEGFGVYRVRYLDYAGAQEESPTGPPNRGETCDPSEGLRIEDWARLDESFWRGVASHHEGAAAWKKIDDAS